MNIPLAKRAQKTDDTIVKTLKLSQQPGIISLAGGLPHADLFPVSEIKTIMAEMSTKELQQSLQYSPTSGLPQLRALIAAQHSKEWGIPLTADHVLITTGSQQGIDLLGKIFIDAGDTIIVERPTYLAAVAAFNNYEAHFTEVEIANSTDNLAELSTALMSKPKFLYAVPTFQNPTGDTWSATTRRKVTELIRKTNVFFVEDNPYAELRFTQESTLPIWTQLPEQTIYLGTCSKTLVPGLRVGFAIAQPEIIQLMTLMKQSADLHTSTLSQMLVLKLMQDNEWYRQHLNTIRAHYKQKAEQMQSLLTQYLKGKGTWTQPKGGMFFWLKTETNTSLLLEKAVQKGVAFMPGAAFYAQDADTTTLRLSFATVSDEDMEKGIKILSELL